MRSFRASCRRASSPSWMLRYWLMGVSSDVYLRRKGCKAGSGGRRRGVGRVWCAWLIGVAPNPATSLGTQSMQVIHLTPTALSHHVRLALQHCHGFSYAQAERVASPLPFRPLTSGPSGLARPPWLQWLLSSTTQTANQPTPISLSHQVRLSLQRCHGFSYAQAKPVASKLPFPSHIRSGSPSSCSVQPRQL